MLFNQVSTLAIAGLAYLGGVAAQNKYPLVGVHTGINPTTGQAPPRKDVRDLFNNKKEFSLLIQALNEVQNVVETNLTSYYQVSGIHGRPFISWDGIDPQEMLVDGIPIGYCPHGNILFGTWHRPYLALIEQIIAKHAQGIAKKYNSSQWTAAANTLRLPYWDWAAAPQAWPTSILSTINITINTPSGDKSVRNPLYRYNFQGVPYPESWFSQVDGDRYFALQPHTLRSPNTQTNISNENNIIEEIPFIGPNLARTVWSVFAKVSVFNDMTTSNANGPDFEGVHGSIHGTVSGHMGPATYAAFDPIFWLHHATVDRQIALWQAIYPDSWITPKESQGGTWTIYPGTIVDANTRLTPFTQADKTTPHTSNSVRHISSFGYSFADIPSHILTGAALSANVTARINQLYNPDGILTRRSVSHPHAKRAEQTEWTVNVKVPNGATGQGFSISLALGSTPVGLVTVLNAPSKVEVDAGSKKVTYGEFSLSPGLEGVSDVEKTIKEGLVWGVVNADGTKVPLDQVKGLEVVVAEQSVVPAADETEFPVFGKKVYRPEILA